MLPADTMLKKGVNKVAGRAVKIDRQIITVICARVVQGPEGSLEIERRMETSGDGELYYEHSGCLHFVKTMGQSVLCNVMFTNNLVRKNRFASPQITAALV